MNILVTTVSGFPLSSLK